MGTRTGRPNGRPSSIDKVVRHRQDGTPVTAAQQVIERITLGRTAPDTLTGAGLAAALFEATTSPGPASATASTK